LGVQHYLQFNFFLAALPVIEKALERAENIHFVYVGVGDRGM
jgi:hypothetical protein